MAVSGSNNFTLTETEIIREALEHCGIDAVEVIESHIYDSARRSLNLLMKSLQADGLFLHTYQSATLFLTLNAQSYLLGPSGAHCTESYVETTLSAAAALGATTISLTSTTGISVSDNIGIVLDSGAIHWTTVSNVSGTTIAVGLPSAAASGKTVFAYTTKISRPLKITDARLKQSTGSEIPINIVSQEDYFRLPNKTTTGRCVQLAYDPQLTNVKIHVWPTADSTTDTIEFRYKKPIDDFDGITNNPAIPIDMLEVVTLGLAHMMGPKLRIPPQDQSSIAQRYKIARDSMDDFEETSIFFQPNRRS